jgi:hypothetical protein
MRRRLAAIEPVILALIVIATYLGVLGTPHG